MKNAETKDRIKEALEIREMRQSELVERTGIDKGQMSSYLTGRYKPKQNNLHAIAEALSVDEAWLMGYDVPMEHNDYEDPNLIIFDAKLEDAWDIIKKAGYSLSLSDDSNKDIIIRNSTNEILACMHDYELVSKYESLQRKGAPITAEALLENSEVTKFFNKINAFDMQLRALGWNYEAKGCHASEHPVKLELYLDDSGNFTDEGSRCIGCGGKRCESCTDKESYYLFSNRQISFKVSMKDYDSFMNDGEAFFKERIQQLLKKSMKQMFIDSKTYLEPQAAHERTDIEVTNEMRKHDDDIMNDDDFWNK